MWLERKHLIFNFYELPWKSLIKVVFKAKLLEHLKLIALIKQEVGTL